MDVAVESLKEDGSLVFWWLINQGNENFKRGQYKTALQHYICAWQIEPLNAVVCSNLASVFIRLIEYTVGDVFGVLTVICRADWEKGYLKSAICACAQKKMDRALKLIGQCTKRCVIHSLDTVKIIQLIEEYAKGDTTGGCVELEFVKKHDIVKKMCNVEKVSQVASSVDTSVQHDFIHSEATKLLLTRVAIILGYFVTDRAGPGDVRPLLQICTEDVKRALIPLLTPDEGVNTAASCQEICEYTIAEAEEILSKAFPEEAECSSQKHRVSETSLVQTFANNLLKCVSLDTMKTRLSEFEVATNCKSKLPCSGPNTSQTTSKAGVVFTSDGKKLLPANREKDSLPVQKTRCSASLLQTECKSSQNAVAANKDTEVESNVRKGPITSEDINNDMLLMLAEEATGKKLSTEQKSQDVVHNLYTGVSCLFEGHPCLALKHFRFVKQVMSQGKTDVNWLGCDSTLLKYLMNIAAIRSKTYENVVTAVHCLKEMEPCTIKLPAVYYLLGCAYYMLNRFKNAVEPLVKCEELLDMCVPFQAYKWPGYDLVIKETTKEGLQRQNLAYRFWRAQISLREEGVTSVNLIRRSLQQKFTSSVESISELMQLCRVSYRPSAVCRYNNCLTISTHIIPSENIFMNDLDFTGFVRLICEERCRIDFHMNCWKLFKDEVSKFFKVTDKDILGSPCLTADCVTDSGNQSTVVLIEVMGDNGSLKTQKKLDSRASKGANSAGNTKKAGKKKNKGLEENMKSVKMVKQKCRKSDDTTTAFEEFVNNNNVTDVGSSKTQSSMLSEQIRVDLPTLPDMSTVTSMSTYNAPGGPVVCSEPLRASPNKTNVSITRRNHKPSNNVACNVASSQSAQPTPPCAQATPLCIQPTALCVNNSLKYTDSNRKSLDKNELSELLKNGGVYFADSSKELPNTVGTQTFSSGDIVSGHCQQVDDPEKQKINSLADESNDFIYAVTHEGEQYMSVNSLYIVGNIFDNTTSSSYDDKKNKRVMKRSYSDTFPSRELQRQAVYCGEFRTIASRDFQEQQPSEQLQSRTPTSLSPRSERIELMMYPTQVALMQEQVDNSKRQGHGRMAAIFSERRYQKLTLRRTVDVATKKLTQTLTKDYYSAKQSMQLQPQQIYRPVCVNVEFFNQLDVEYWHEEQSGCIVTGFMLCNCKILPKDTEWLFRFYRDNCGHIKRRDVSLSGEEAESLEDNINSHHLFGDGRPIRIQWMYDLHSTRYISRYDPYVRSSTAKKSSSDCSLTDEITKLRCIAALLSNNTETYEYLTEEENEEKTSQQTDDSNKTNLFTHNTNTDEKEMWVENKQTLSKQVTDQNSPDVSVHGASCTDALAPCEIECNPSQNILDISAHSIGNSETQEALLEIELDSLNQVNRQNEQIITLCSEETKAQALNEDKRKALVSDQCNKQNVLVHSFDTETLEAQFEAEPNSLEWINNQNDQIASVCTKIPTESGDQTLNQITIQKEDNFRVLSKCTESQETSYENKQNGLQPIVSDKNTTIVEKQSKRDTNKQHKSFDCDKNLPESQTNAATIGDAQHTEQNSNHVLLKFLCLMRNFVKKFTYAKNMWSAMSKLASLVDVNDLQNFIMSDLKKIPCEEAVGIMEVIHTFTDSGSEETNQVMSQICDQLAERPVSYISNILQAFLTRLTKMYLEEENINYDMTLVSYCVQAELNNMFGKQMECLEHECKKKFNRFQCKIAELSGQKLHSTLRNVKKRGDVQDVIIKEQKNKIFEYLKHTTDFREYLFNCIIKITYKRCFTNIDYLNQLLDISNEVKELHCWRQVETKISEWNSYFKYYVKLENDFQTSFKKCRTNILSMKEPNIPNVDLSSFLPEPEPLAFNKIISEILDYKHQVMNAPTESCRNNKPMLTCDKSDETAIKKCTNCHGNETCHTETMEHDNTRVVVQSVGIQYHRNNFVCIPKLPVQCRCGILYELVFDKIIRTPIENKNPCLDLTDEEKKSLKRILPYIYSVVCENSSVISSEKQLILQRESVAELSLNKVSENSTPCATSHKLTKSERKGIKKNKKVTQNEGGNCAVKCVMKEHKSVEPSTLADSNMQAEKKSSHLCSVVECKGKKSACVCTNCRLCETCVSYLLSYLNTHKHCSHKSTESVSAAKSEAETTKSKITETVPNSTALLDNFTKTVSCAKSRASSTSNDKTLADASVGKSTAKASNSKTKERVLNSKSIVSNKISKEKIGKSQEIKKSTVALVNDRLRIESRALSNRKSTITDSNIRSKAATSNDKIAADAVVGKVTERISSDVFTVTSDSKSIVPGLNDKSTVPVSDIATETAPSQSVNLVVHETPFTATETIDMSDDPLPTDQIKKKKKRNRRQKNRNRSPVQSPVEEDLEPTDQLKTSHLSEDEKSVSATHDEEEYSPPTFVDTSEEKVEWSTVKKKTPSKVNVIVPVLAEPKVKSCKMILLNKLHRMYELKSAKELEDVIKHVREQNNGSLTGLPVDEIVARVDQLFQESYMRKHSTMGLEKFKTTPWGDVKNKLRQPSWSGTLAECAICLEKMSQDNQTVLDCRHPYHTDCIQKWLTENRVCPLCKTFATMPGEFPALPQ